jgi:hypothetical protein
MIPNARNGRQGAAPFALGPTKRYVNWEQVQMNSVNLTGVTSLSVNPDGKLLKFSGDGDKYMTCVVIDVQDPSVDIVCADVEAMRTVPCGTRGPFTATQLDAKNLATPGGGGLIFSSADAIVENNPTSGDHRAYAKGTLNVSFESVDGQTNPLLSTAV